MDPGRLAAAIGAIAPGGSIVHTERVDGVLDLLDERAGGRFAGLDAAGRERVLDGLLDNAEYLWFADTVNARFYADPASWPSVGWDPWPGAAPQHEIAEPARRAVIRPGALRQRYDAVVVGSGAGGGVAAWALARSGRSVLLVERGGFPGPGNDHLHNPRVDGSLAYTFGGGTRVYGAQAWRFTPEDFTMAGTYGVPDGSALADWPVGYDETVAVPLAINSVPYDGRPACAGSRECVGFACRVDAKNGSHNTVLARAALTGNLSVLLQSRVRRIVTMRGRVTGVELAGGQRIDAADVVVAAGAVESARLLLCSAPGGLGNEHDQVGRYLQGHVYGGAIGIFDDVVADLVGPGPSISTHDFRHHNDGLVGGGMIADEFVSTPRMTYAYLRQAGLIGPHGAAAGMRRLARRMQRVVGPVQEVTSAGSRVRIDPSVTDEHGVPVVRLSGGLHPNDIAAQRLLGERAAEWLRAAGAVTAVAYGPPPADRPSHGQHQAGTCRMGTDPAISVTDPGGRVWGHDNLRVVDASLHVTNGGVNPVLTVFANALRIMHDWIPS